MQYQKHIEMRMDHAYWKFSYSVECNYYFSPIKCSGFKRIQSCKFTYYI